MNYSKDGVHLTESFEGCKLTAYPDSKGVPTIGYGHTHGVRLGQVCTQVEAEAWLQEDIAWAVSVVNRDVTRTITQGEFDALVDFTFNAGSGRLFTSTLLRLVNSGDMRGAALEFEKWDKCGGKIVAGLLRRRTAEAHEFQTV